MLANCRLSVVGGNALDEVKVVCDDRTLLMMKMVLLDIYSVVLDIIKLSESECISF